MFLNLLAILTLEDIHYFQGCSSLHDTLG